MGAGFAGVCQARHLLLNLPGIRVAIVDPRSLEPDKKEHRLGESTVDIASVFLIKELGLHEYLIENHTPKAGLNFHWPKEFNKTESIDDYFNVWVNQQLKTPAFHLNRSKFDRDILKMNLQMGAHFYNGRVVDVELTPKDNLHIVQVKLDDKYLELKAKHLIDTAGRKFIIGRKTDNLMFDPKDLYGINSGSAWVWVKNVDRTLLDNGWHPNEGLVTRYYCTNHWMGHGHWLWMIPLDKDSMELSVGVIHHKDVIPSEYLNSKEKFYEFLKANHNLLYQILASGEHMDFNYWSRIAHKSKIMFSPDNWYVMGDAANNFDALYSMGTSMSALAIESVTEIIRAKLAGEADVEQKREAYNRFNVAFADFANHLVCNQSQHMGNASMWKLM
ncbi:MULTISPECIES: NAD(P)/FAD-dependent oxidoreductase [Fischerella]